MLNRPQSGAPYWTALLIIFSLVPQCVAQTAPDMKERYLRALPYLLEQRVNAQDEAAMRLGDKDKVIADLQTQLLALQKEIEELKAAAVAKGN